MRVFGIFLMKMRRNGTNEYIMSSQNQHMAISNNEQTKWTLRICNVKHFDIKANFIYVGDTK